MQLSGNSIWNWQNTASLHSWDNVQGQGSYSRTRQQRLYERSNSGESELGRAGTHIDGTRNNPVSDYRAEGNEYYSQVCDSKLKQALGAESDTSKRRESGACTGYDRMHNAAFVAAEEPRRSPMDNHFSSTTLEIPFLERESEPPCEGVAPETLERHRVRVQERLKENMRRSAATFIKPKPQPRLITDEERQRSCEDVKALWSENRKRHFQIRDQILLKMAETKLAEKYNRREEDIERAYKVYEANYLKKLKDHLRQERQKAYEEEIIDIVQKKLCLNYSEIQRRAEEELWQEENEEEIALAKIKSQLVNFEQEESQPSSPQSQQVVEDVSAKVSEVTCSSSNSDVPETQTATENPPKEIEPSVSVKNKGNQKSGKQKKKGSKSNTAHSQKDSKGTRKRR